MQVFRRIILLVVALTVLLPSAALAGGPGKWTRVTGEESWFELNLARVKDKLHVSVREDQSSSTYRLIHRSISRSGNVGPVHAVASDFEYLGYYPGIVPLDGGGVRMLFGSRDTGDGFSNSSMRYVDSMDGGETWSAPVQSGVTEAPAQSPSEMDATVGPAGVSFQVWEGTLCICVQRGLDPENTHTNFNDIGGNNMDPSIAYDNVTGKMWVSWLVFGNDVDGIYVRQADTATGEPVGPSTLVPGSYDTYNGDRLINFQNGRVPMVERTTGFDDGGGVYVAYRKGYPTAKKVNVWRVGSAEPVTVAQSSKGIGEVALAVNGGKIWALWESGDRIFARRSSFDVKNWGKTVSTKVPADSVGLSTLQADAQGSKVDILAYVSKVTGSGFFHTQLKPGITFKAPPSKFRGKTSVTFITKDAGAALAGAKVTVDGKSCKTNFGGRCSITLGPYASNKTLKAKATHPNYARAILKLRALV